MGKVTIMPDTTKYPITLIGKCAGICWNADITNDTENYRRGIDCLESNHGRTIEYPNIVAVIEGYSARMIREWYTHIGCLPSRLQESTRYVDYRNFTYVTPHTVKASAEATKVYDGIMKAISKGCAQLEEMGIPREDSAMPLPLAMCTKMVDKRNLRNVIDMSHQRECTRAFWEFREMFSDYCNALSAYSDEWAYLAKNYFKPKCELYGYCPEKHGCGAMPGKA